MDSPPMEIWTLLDKILWIENCLDHKVRLNETRIYRDNGSSEGTGWWAEFDPGVQVAFRRGEHTATVFYGSICPDAEDSLDELIQKLEHYGWVRCQSQSRWRWLPWLNRLRGKTSCSGSKTT